MAIYHFSVQVISRSAGRSVVAAAAYRAGERLIDDRVGRVHDYSHKPVAHSEILCPAGAPDWTSNRERLWNEVERAEKRVDSQLCREIRLALPTELSDGQQLKLARRFFNDNCVKRGMVVDFAIHRDNPENPHVHALLTMRSLDRRGFGNKERDWNRKDLLELWREEWQQCANRSLARAGHRSRIDHRSFATRGFLTIPGVKVGIQKLFASTEKRTVFQERLAKSATILALNGEAIRQDPAAALQELTYHQATFTRADVRKWLKGRTTEDQQESCLHAILSEPGVVVLHEGPLPSAPDTDSGGSEVQPSEGLFSTQDMLGEERGLLSLGYALAREKDHPAPATEQVAATCLAMGLSEEQQGAVQHIMEGGTQISLVVGYAGTGKSYMLRACKDLWERQGRTVYGMALSGKAAEGLLRGANIADSRSIAAWEYAWKEGRASVGRGDVLVVDEAGMVGTRQMRCLLERASRAGAKVVMVGDPEQLQAVEAGSPFRALVDMTPTAELVSIRRQREEWQRAASLDLARGHTAAAIGAYEQRGHVHRHDNDGKAVAHIMAEWERHERDCGRESQVVLAYRRAQVPEVNDAIHQMRKQMGVLGREHQVQAENGRRLMAHGDRVCFLKNNRKMGVKNGTLGTIESLAGDRMAVKLDGQNGARVEFDYRKWTHFDLGYSVTVAKSQGMTVDRAHVLTSRAFDRHATNVAMTRHAGRLDIYYSAEEFGRGARSLNSMLSRKRHKAMALDHLPPEKAPVAAQEVPKEAASDPNLGRTVARAAAALRAAQEVAARKPLTFQSALYMLEPVAQASDVLKKAAETRAWWREREEAHRGANPIMARLGRRPVEYCPETGRETRLQDGLEASEKALERAAAALEAELIRPALRELAKERARSSEVEIRSAAERLPQLRAEYEKARVCAESFLRVERNTEPDRSMER